MKVDCANCGRSFDLDAQRLENVPALQCLCGHRLPLKPEAGATPRLGKYLLVNRIAVGGMGEIYYGKVSGIEGFEKEVAIKRMLPHLSADRDFINMMVKEAKLTVLLNHPNIVGVYDLAKESDEYYIAMEYVPGVTVGAILEAARKAQVMLPLEVPVHITLQILRGLAYAHNLPGPNGERLTILHRDITPQKILVTGSAFVKITDFGIAKAVNEISTTSPGMIKGKLGYIAPEQLEGKEPDQRVDIFCAAILLWEMLAVRRLFKGATEVDTFRLISVCKIPPLSQYRQDVPPNVEAVLHRGLAKDPQERFSRSEEFAAALSQAIFPRTPDAFAEVTAAFFSQHPEFFASVAAHKGGSLDSDDSTRTVPITGTQPTAPQNLELVTKFLRREAAETQPPGTGGGKLSRYIIGAAAAVVIALLGLTAALLMRNAPSTPAPLAMQQRPSSMFPPAPSAPVPTSPPATSAPSPTPTPPAPKPAPRRESSRLERTPLSEQEINSAFQRTYPSLLHCLHQFSAQEGGLSRVDATIGIDSNGKVSLLQFKPKLSGDNASCMTSVLKKVQLRHHPDPDLQVHIPIMIKKLGT